MKAKKLLSLLSVLPLISCTSDFVLESKVFYFDTMVDIKLFEGNRYYLEFAKYTLSEVDKLSDNYHLRDANNVYAINRSNEEMDVEPDWYDLLCKSFSVQAQGATYFNPLCGSLAQLWKDSLANNTVPSEEAIATELTKMNNSSLSFVTDSSVRRNGDATIDLGGIAKGYALDLIHDVYEQNNIYKYLINAGSSSILLGKKPTKSGYFAVGIKDLEGVYLKLKNCFVSCSGKSEQSVTIDGVTYSHIINPVTGSAVTLNDAVIVVSDSGYLGDALSTSMMMNTIEEIQEIEETVGVKTIVIRKGKKVYSHKDLKIYYH